jgi:hypothetical protein
MEKEGVRLEENEEEDDDSYPMSPEDYGDTAMEDNEEEGGGTKEEQRASDEPADGLGRVISDAKQQCDTKREKLKLEAMQKDHKKLLYPNCENDSTKLGTILELLKWKAEASLSDKGFEKLLKIMKPKLPVVTQHTTACCSTQVVDITLVKYQFTNITSLRVVQQKHSGLYSSTEYYKPKSYNGFQFLLGPKRNTRRFYPNITKLV